MLLGAVGCTVSLLTSPTPEKRESFALLPQTPGLNRAWKVRRPSYNIPFRGIVLSHNFLSLSAGKCEHLVKTSSSTPSWDEILAPPRVFLGPLHWFELPVVFWSFFFFFGGQKDKMEEKRASQISILLCWPASFFSTVCLSFYFTPVPSSCLISESSRKFTLLTESPQNKTNSTPTHFSPTALFTLRNTSALSM